MTVLPVLTLLFALAYVAVHKNALDLYKYWAATTNHKRSMTPVPLRSTQNGTYLDAEDLNRWRQENIIPYLPPVKIHRLERVGLIVGSICCLFFAATMIQLILYAAWVQAILATVALAVSTGYSIYFWQSKQEVRIAIDVHKQYPAPC